MYRTHRIGTITLGITLMLFGILFLVHLFIPALTYSLILKCWPVVFIFLGVEVLLSVLGKKKVPIAYDKAGIFITAALVFFSMIMGCASICMEYAAMHI